MHNSLLVNSVHVSIHREVYVLLNDVWKKNCIL